MDSSKIRPLPFFYMKEAQPPALQPIHLFLDSTYAACYDTNV